VGRVGGAVKRYPQNLRERERGEVRREAEAKKIHVILKISILSKY
jgi:hypothetical protein